MFEGGLLNMKIEAIITDMDGTLVQYENSDYKSSWDAIGNRLTGWRKDQWFLNLDKAIDRNSFSFLFKEKSFAKIIAK